jgi:3-oxoadipate enol-lactonase
MRARARNTDHGDMQRQHGTTTSRGAEIAFAVEGEGAETVLLVTGLGWRGADWGSDLPSRLAQRYRVVRFDNRGTGASSLSAAGFGLADMAADAVAVLDAVDARTAHVVGISMGGMITQLVALDHPDRVDTATLIATHFGGVEVVPPLPEAMKLFDPAEFIARGRDPAAMMRYQLEVICAPGFVRRNPAAVELMCDNVRAQPTTPNGFLSQLQAILSSDRSERVRDIGKPTLVLHGDSDALIPLENGRRLAARIPHARLEVIAECGHVVPLEAPEAVSRLLLQFFEARG